MDSPFYPDNKKKKILLRRGLEDYVFDISPATEKVINNIISNYFATQEVTEKISQETSTHQHWSKLISLDESPKEISFSTMGFPSSIDLAMPPILIPHSDRNIVLDNYSNTSVTIKSSVPGVKDLPLSVKVEVVGYAEVIPSYIYHPLIVGIDFLDDRGAYIYQYDGEGFTLKSFSAGIKDLPISVGVYITGKKNTDDIDRGMWYAEVTLSSNSQDYEYKDISWGKTDNHIFDTGVELTKESDTFSFVKLIDAEGYRLPNYISNARISALIPCQDAMGYISAINNYGFTLNFMHGSTADLPIRFKLQIRGE